MVAEQHPIPGKGGREGGLSLFLYQQTKKQNKTESRTTKSFCSSVCVCFFKQAGPYFVILGGGSSGLARLSLPVCMAPRRMASAEVLPGGWWMYYNRMGWGVRWVPPEN